MGFAEGGGDTGVREGVGGRGETAFVGLAGGDVRGGVERESRGEEVEESGDR